MAAQLNYANLLAFVQVGVALNFGLLFLTRRNVLKDVYFLTRVRYISIFYLTLFYFSSDSIILIHISQFY